MTREGLIQFVLFLANSLLTGCFHNVGEEPTVVVSKPTVMTEPVVGLTWLFSRTLGESDGGPERDLDVIVSVGENVQRVKLNRHYGSLVPFEQSVCNRRLTNANVVSSIKLHTMGETTIVAQRIAPTLLEITFTVEADDEPSKTHGVLGRIAIPKGARVVDQIHEVSEDGTVVPFNCSSTAWRDQ